jgi:hypothetical protein
MKYLIKESQYVYLLENLEKTKKFLTNHIGIDFTGKFKKITKAFDIPYNFFRKGGISLNAAMSFIEAFGPMYFFELGDREYLYQDRGNKDWFVDEYGHLYIKDEFSKRLGIDELGLRFSDIIDMHSNEEEPLNESVDKNKKFLTKLLGDDLINSIQEITSPKQLPIEFLKSIGTSIIQRYIDVYGPLYYFVLDGEPFLYKERISPKGEKYEMYITDKGKSYLEGEITDRLGLSDMGLGFSDVIDTFHNEGESINENIDKNKKFLTNVMGIDFTGNIEQVTSTYDVPMEFDNNISPAAINYYLNKFGPMYLFELDGIKYLYQDQDHGDFFIDDYGFYYNDEIPEQLGIDDLGLRFSDIINIFFNEEEDEVITEGKQDNMIERLLKSEGITYDINYKKRSYFNGDQLDSVDITFYFDRGDRKKYVGTEPVYFKTRGNKIIPYAEPIIYGDFDYFFDVFDAIPTVILNKFFADKAKSYLEEYLPIEYPFG